MLNSVRIPRAILKDSLEVDPASRRNHTPYNSWRYRVKTRLGLVPYQAQENTLNFRKNSFILSSLTSQLTRKLTLRGSSTEVGSSRP